jgi:hypothetical protein
MTSGLSRRGFLKAAAATGASTVFWRRKALAGNTAPIKRLIVVHCPGAVRWDSCFDGQSDPFHNPWGILQQSLVGRGKQPAWGFSRMFQQRPLKIDSTGWATTIYPYLTSNSLADYNLSQPVLTTPGWKGAALPTLWDVNQDIAVVRCTANPGGEFNSDHNSASHTLFTGFSAGQVGVETAFQAALQAQLGSQFDTQYPLPAVAIGQEAWTYGVGAYASSRAMYLGNPLLLPTTNPGVTLPAFAKKIEGQLDNDYAHWLQTYMQQAVENFISDKASADVHIGQLVNPALHFESPQPTTSPSLGTLIDGSTAVTNQMLFELFGIDSASTPAGDILFDVFGALADVAASSATWVTGNHAFGLNGAVAIRLLQMGAPMVVVTQGSFDSHSYEVVGPASSGKFQATQVIQLGRLFATLNFALKNIEDPLSPGQSLWASTVVMACSEFGRGGGNIGTNGFNSPDGQNGGGSDHDPWSAWPLMGGPLSAGGHLLVSSANAGFYQQNCIFTTLMQGFGVSSCNNGYLPYGTFPTISGLIQGV